MENDVASDAEEILHRERCYSTAVQDAVRNNDIRHKSKTEHGFPIALITFRMSDSQAVVREICESEIFTVMDTLAKNEIPCFFAMYHKGEVLTYQRDYFRQKCFVVKEDTIHEHKQILIDLALRHRKKEQDQRKAELHERQRKIIASNLNCIFTLKDAQDGTIFRCHLRRFADEPVPNLPVDVEPINSNSGIGIRLLEWQEGEDVYMDNPTYGVVFHYQVVERKPYRLFTKRVLLPSNLPFPQIDIADSAKHANGHRARERNGWGSFPMHDAYGDESTGEEHDYEDWAEYSANYE